MSYKSYNNYLGSNRCCNTTATSTKSTQGAQGSAGPIGPIGLQGFTGAQGPPGTGFTGSTGAQGAQGAQGAGVNIGITGYGNMVVYDPIGSTFFYSELLRTDENLAGSAGVTGITGPIIWTSGHILPTTNNTYHLGATGFCFSDLFMSGGTIYMLNGASGSTGVDQSGSLGLNNNGLVYTAKGFATPFATIFNNGEYGPSGPAGATGNLGWKIGSTGSIYENNLDLTAQGFFTNGLTDGLTGALGPNYSLIRPLNVGSYGPTGSTLNNNIKNIYFNGNQFNINAITGATGLTGVTGIGGVTGYIEPYSAVLSLLSGATGAQGPSIVINTINQEVFSKTVKLNSVYYPNQTSIKTSDVKAELDNFTDNQEIYTFGPTIQNRWVSVGNASSITYSSDGLNWFKANDTLFNANAYGVEWNGIMWVAVGDNSASSLNSICYSYDGIIWNPSKNPSAFVIGYCVAWNDSMWIAGGESTRSNMWYSYDGMNWRETPSGDINIVYDIAWNGNMWVAVGSSSVTSIVYSYSGLPGTWIPITSVFATGSGVAWNGNMWIAVGTAGIGQICYSYDGITWLFSANPFSSVGLDIKWNGIMWVATGDGNPIVYSYDGFTWNNCIIFGTSGIYNSLCWNGTRWVAIDSQNGNTLAYSNSGINWVTKTNNEQKFGFGIAYNRKRQDTLTFPKNRLVAVGLNYTLYSDDGIVWQALNIYIPFKTGRSIDWNGEMWVAVGDDLALPTSTSTAYSYNGTDWINATNIFTLGRGVKWNGYMWVAVGSRNTTFDTPIAYSYDGICWKKAFVPSGTEGFAVDWNGEIWVAGVDDSKTLVYSSNGDTWSAATVASSFKCYTVVWNGTIWVAAGNTVKPAYSYDGKKWLNSSTTTPFNNIYSAAWNGSMWLIGGDVSPYVAYSYDGITWATTNVSSPPANTIFGITWDGNKWIAVAGAGQIYYSYDGFEWTNSTVPTRNPIYAVAWNKNLGSTYIQQPVISLGSGTTNSIAYSLDGIKYTGLGNQNSLFNEGRAAAWNGSMWVAVGSGGTNTIIYSYDGIEWIPVANSNTYIKPGFAVVWTGINWVVTGTPIGNNIYYSPDGINWRRSSPNNANTYNGLATDVKTIGTGSGTQSTTVAVGNVTTPTNSNIIYSINDGLNWTVATTLPTIQLYCVAWNGTTWLTGGNSGNLYSSPNGISWSSTPIPVGSIVIIRSIAWNGDKWIVVGDNVSGAIQIYYTTVLNGQSGWTLATIFVTALISPLINLFSVIWNGKRWITGGQDKTTNISYIFTSHDGILWYESPPVTTPLNPYANPLKEIVYGLASNSRVGGVIVDSQIALNNNNSVNLTTKLDLYSDDYYNNGYNNMTVSIKSSDLL